MKKPANVVLSLAVILVLVAVSPAVAADGEPASLDPVVAEVLEMIEAGVSDDLILRWLESTGRRPADVSAAGVIALTAAEASEALVESLLSLAGEGEMAAEEAVAEKVPAVEVAVVEEVATGGGPVEARFLIKAKELYTDEPEPDSPPPAPWDVYVYLDGEYLGWVTPSLQAEPVEVVKVLPAGEHVLRVLLQRHDPKSRHYRYESLSVPVAVTFEAAGGDPLEIDVEMKRIWGLWRAKQSGGPLSYRIRQGMKTVAEHQGTGGDPDHWRAVCEDIEANFPDAKKVPSIHRTKMASCIRWSDLWADFGIVTSRDEILEMLDSYDFAPPVRSF